MSRLLIRTGKDPFTAVSAETTLTQDVFNSNSGNLLFQHAVWESLAIDGAELTANATLSERRSTSDRDIDRVNERFDHFVVPFANAFRTDFVRQLERLTGFIERLTIPVSVIGVGAQAPAGLDLDALAPVRDVTQRFVRAVLDRSPTIGVRGEFTRRFLMDLGFDDASIDVIGCPSLFREGPNLRVQKKVESIGADSLLALNLTPEVPGIGAFTMDQMRRHPNLTYIGQDGHDLRLLLWGTQRPNVSDPEVPTHLRHPLYTEGRMNLFVDQWTWFSYLASRDFAYGTRFHGNVAALMAGTPAMLLAHDSRTVELAEYHQMPHRLVPEFDAPLSAETLYEETDLSGFNRALPEGFERYRVFLERHGLAHRWQDGVTTQTFDNRRATATFPPAVRPVTSPDLIEVVSRLDWVRHGMVLDMTRHPDRVKYAFEYPAYAGAGSRHARLLRQRDAQIKGQATELEKLTARIAELERRENSSLEGLARRLVNRMRRLFRR